MYIYTERTQSLTQNHLNYNYWESRGFIADIAVDKDTEEYNEWTWENLGLTQVLCNVFWAQSQ